MPAPGGVTLAPITRPEASIQVSMCKKTGALKELPPDAVISEVMVWANTVAAGPAAAASARERLTVAR